MSKLLIVDDDLTLCRLLTDLFSNEGHIVDVANNVDDAKQFISQYGYDLVVLDWDLDGTSGTDLLKNLRSGGFNTPCIMLTGRKDEDSIEYGLIEAGADDYLTKPFSGKELNARIIALIRRKSSGFSRDIISIRDLKLDCSRKTILCGTRSAQLQRHEFMIIELLMKSPGSFFTAETLLSRLWDSESDVSIDTVRMHISRIRKKLKDIGAEQFLEMERGHGYRIP